jgi:hypothetical protein
MAEWFVRPDTSHSGTRNGQSYDFAWGGWSEIVWGTSGVNTGDTLYICGAHTYTSIIALGNVTGVTIRGDHSSRSGSLSFRGNNIYFNINRNSTTIEALTITSENRCIVPAGTPLNGLTIRNCTLNGSNLPAIEFLAINTWGWVNTTIDGNTFNGGVGGGGGAAITWWPQTAITTYHENLKITNNTFNGCSATQGVIVLLGTTTSAATIRIYDLQVSGNTFTNCGGTAIKAYVPQTGRNKGVKIYRNKITNQSRIGALGGGIVVGGFVQSSTADFGQNVIEHNVADGLQGTTGFANIMYGSYIIRHNVGKNISSIIYDGIGLLFDLGSDGCVAYGNYLENLSGPSDFTAGAGIGIIYDATNITCYGNVIKNCYMGVFYGNQTSGRVSNIFNNTFIDCKLAGIRGNATTFPNDANYCKNNIFTTSEPSSVGISYLTGVWNRESNNVFFGFKSGTQALNASSLNVNPDLDPNYRPRSSKVKRAGAYLGGKDYYGKQFYNTPNIGAVEDVTDTPRYTLRYR